MSLFRKYKWNNSKDVENYNFCFLITRMFSKSSRTLFSNKFPKITKWILFFMLSVKMKSRSNIFRLWWLVIFILCVSGSVFMIYQICDKWTTTPVLVSLATNEKSISEIPFPAVTICPESRISTKCVNYTKILLARQSGNLSETTFQE